MPLPLDVLEKQIDKQMVLLLKDGRNLEGKLRGFDQYMNLVLEEVEETTRDGDSRRLGTVVLRGNNVVTITPS